MFRLLDWLLYLSGRLTLLSEYLVPSELVWIGHGFFQEAGSLHVVVKALLEQLGLLVPPVLQLIGQKEFPFFDGWRVANVD